MPAAAATKNVVVEPLRAQLDRVFLILSLIDHCETACFCKLPLEQGLFREV